MKLVNLYTGQKRLLSENFRSYQNVQLDEKEKNYNFFVFWDDSLITKDEEKILKNILRNYKYIIIKKKKFLTECKNQLNQIKSNKLLNGSDKNQLFAWLSQYYILLKAFKHARRILGKKSENFIWQRIRSDIYIPNKLKIEKIINNRKLLLFPGAKFSFGLNDFHCIGGYNSFKDYAESINLLKTLIEKKIYIPPEVMISLQLTRKKSLFSINSSLPVLLIGKKNNRTVIRTLESQEKGYQYINFNFSNYYVQKNKINKSDRFFYSILRRFIYFFKDIYIYFLFNLKK